jgi:hypothetical protein
MHHFRFEQGGGLDGVVYSCFFFPLTFLSKNIILVTLASEVVFAWMTSWGSGWETPGVCLGWIWFVALECYVYPLAFLRFARIFDFFLDGREKGSSGMGKGL